MLDPLHLPRQRSVSSALSQPGPKLGVFPPASVPASSSALLSLRCVHVDGQRSSNMLSCPRWGMLLNYLLYHYATLSVNKHGVRPVSNVKVTMMMIVIVVIISSPLLKCCVQMVVYEAAGVPHVTFKAGSCQPQLFIQSPCECHAWVTVLCFADRESMGCLRDYCALKAFTVKYGWSCVRLFQHSTLFTSLLKFLFPLAFSSRYLHLGLCVFWLYKPLVELQLQRQHGDTRLWQKACSSERSILSGGWGLE